MLALDAPAPALPAPPTAPADEPVGLWLSISELAAQKGVTKQAVSERVQKLGLETRKGKRGAKLVNLAAFEHAVAASGDPAKEAAAATSASNRAAAGAAGEIAAGGMGESLFRNNADRKAAFEADLKEIELNEKLGKVLRIEDVEAAMIECGVAFVRALDRMVARADELVTVALKDGVVGVRGKVKEIARDLRTEIAANMRVTAAGEVAGEGQL